jgi:hypothetical protein
MNINYFYHIEDGQFSFDHEDKRLLGNEGDVIEIPNDFGDASKVYILYIEGSYIECIGEIERSFPKNWAEHMEIRKYTQELHKSDDDIEDGEEQIEDLTLYTNDD